MSAIKSLEKLEEAINIEYYIGKKAADEIRNAFNKKPAALNPASTGNQPVKKATIAPGKKPTKSTAAVKAQVKSEDA